MSVLNLVRRSVPSGVKRFFKKKMARDARLVKCLSPFLPPVICVDVGASYYPHPKWKLFLESTNTEWIAVEPNKSNLSYVGTWSWPCRISACTTGLSDSGGAKTLYVTNVDSGSSLLEPFIPASMSRRVLNLDYFFPVRTREIDTLQLIDVVADKIVTAPIFVKLDTQGTELSILAGAEALLRDRRIIGVELEATLLAQPLMKGAGKFWQACEYLESLGFELLHLHTIYGPSRLGLKNPQGLTFINECDAVFAIRQDIAATLSLTHRAALFAFYLCNKLYEEALLLIRDDAELGRFLTEHGCSVAALIAAIKALA